MSPLWKCTDIKSLGNILTITAPNSPPRIIVIESSKSVAEVGLDGKVIAVHKLNIGDAEFITNIRAFTAADGKRYIAVFAGFQQRCHLLDDQWNIALSYPEDVIEHPHSGIADVELDDLDGDGDAENVHQLIGASSACGPYRSRANPSGRTARFPMRVRMAVTGADADGRRDLLCTNNNGTLVELDAKGQRQTEISVPNRTIGWIVGGDLQGNGQLLWCGLVRPENGRNHRTGLQPQRR